MEATLAANEQQRPEELKSLGILDTLPEQNYEDLVLLVAQFTNPAISLISLLAEDHQ